MGAKVEIQFRIFLSLESEKEDGGTLSIQLQTL